MVNPNDSLSLMNNSTDSQGQQQPTPAMPSPKGSAPPRASSASLGQISKARLHLYNSDRRNMGGAPPEKYEFQFNPEELSISRGVDTDNGGAEAGRDPQGYPKTSFSGPRLGVLNISNIIIDTLENNQDLLKDHVGILKGMLELYPVSGGQKRAPIYQFIWGETEYITCFVKSIDFNYTLFTPNGRPVRAKVKMTLQEIKEVHVKSQSPAPA